MIHKILVAIDTSAIGKSVFEEALFLAKAANANLMLLHVLSIEEEGMPTSFSMEPYGGLSDQTLKIYQQLWEKFKKQGLDLLQSLKDRAAAAGVNTECVQHVGGPGRTICELARTWEADLIVVGRRGHSGLSELILGSVSNYVLHHAPCSVLTVQHPVNANTEAAGAEQVATGL